MAARRSRRARFRKKFITVLKWVSAIAPVIAFIYILYYYKQFDFLTDEPQVVTKTEVVDPSDSLVTLFSFPKGTVTGKIKVLQNEWHSVGGVAIHNLTIENGSDKTTKSVEVEFKYLSDTQAVVTSKIITIKAAIPAGKSNKVSGVSVGYVNNSIVGCETEVLNVKY